MCIRDSVIPQIQQGDQLHPIMLKVLTCLRIHHLPTACPPGLRTPGDQKPQTTHEPAHGEGQNEMKGQ
eukprot:13286574-Alexandrium_andersonii.AAC.1